MLHGKRAHNIKTYTDLDLLVSDFRRHTWTLCSGFRFGNVVLLNDSTHEDAIQEYAIAIVGDDGNGKFVDSYTISWMEADSLKQHILDLEAGASTPGPTSYGPYTKREHKEECSLCA